MRARLINDRVHEGGGGRPRCCCSPVRCADVGGGIGSLVADSVGVGRCCRGVVVVGARRWHAGDSGGSGCVDFGWVGVRCGARWCVRWDPAMAVGARVFGGLGITAREGDVGCSCGGFVIYPVGTGVCEYCCGAPDGVVGCAPPVGRGFAVGEQVVGVDALYVRCVGPVLAPRLHSV